MIYLKIIELIKNEELARRVVNELMNREETQCHKKYTEELLYERVHDIYCSLGYWLDRARPKEEVDKFYHDLGKKRFHDGIPLHEAIMFIMLIKRHLWLYLLEKHFFESSFEMMKALELNNRIVLFFDRTILAVTKGYEDELVKEIKTSAEGFLGRFFKKRCD